MIMQLLNRIAQVAELVALKLDGTKSVERPAAGTVFTICHGCGKAEAPRLQDVPDVPKGPGAVRKAAPVWCGHCGHFFHSTGCYSEHYDAEIRAANADELAAAADKVAGRRARRANRKANAGR